MTENFDMPFFLILQTFFISCLCQIQPGSFAFPSNRGIICENIKNNHMTGIIGKSLQTHIRMSVIFFCPSFDPHFFHQFSNRFPCHLVSPLKNIPVRTDFLRHGFRFPWNIRRFHLVIRQRQRHNAASHPYKHFRLVKFLFKLLHQFRGQGSEIFFSQTDYQKITGDNVINLPVIIPQRPVQLASIYLAFLIHHESNFFIERIDRFNITAHSFLQIFQFTANLNSLGIHSRFDQKNIHQILLILHDLSFRFRIKGNPCEIFGVQNIFRIIICLFYLFFSFYKGSGFHCYSLFKHFCDFDIIFFQSFRPPFLLDIEKATIYKPYSS